MQYVFVLFFLFIYYFYAGSPQDRQRGPRAEQYNPSIPLQLHQLHSSSFHARILRCLLAHTLHRTQLIQYLKCSLWSPMASTNFDFLVLSGRMQETYLFYFNQIYLYTEYYHFQKKVTNISKIKINREAKVQLCIIASSPLSHLSNRYRVFTINRTQCIFKFNFAIVKILSSCLGLIDTMVSHKCRDTRLSV